MNVIEWLLDGDYAIERLTSKYLLEKELLYKDTGLIKKYLDHFDHETKLWGGGIYSPKWVSTHYTLKMLKYLEINKDNQLYHQGLEKLMDNLWRKSEETAYNEDLDLCIIGMIVSFIAYGNNKDKRVYEMIDCILKHQMDDGGFNCRYNYERSISTKSSVHTTLTILEAFRDFKTLDEDYKSEEINKVTKEAQEYLLKRRLFYRLSTGDVMRESFKKAHFPPRWKYDYLRAFEYFVSVNHPYNKGMEEGIDLILARFNKYGFMLRGSQYPGRKYFKLENTTGGRFNTLRALKVLKKYKPKKYYEIVKLNNDKLM